MTTELEKQFFDTYGIEPIAEYCRHQCNYELDESACIGCKYIEKVEYPQITDRHYLELMCLYTKEIKSFVCYTSNLKMLKEEVLKEFISEKDGFTKHQVQAIFEGER